MNLPIVEVGESKQSGEKTNFKRKSRRWFRAKEAAHEAATFRS
jgi:hypothetical protein